MKNILNFVFAIMISSIIAFSACTNGSFESFTDKNALTMEAEYVDIDEVAGAGISNSIDGLNMIIGEGTKEQKKMWSNGYYVGYTHNSMTELEFVFNSSVATTAYVTFMLGSEIGDIILNSDSIAVFVNGENQILPNWKVIGSKMKMARFTACKLPNPVALNEGENKIIFKVLANNLGGHGATRGPYIDCVRVSTRDTFAELSWNPHVDNIQRRDGEV